MMSGFVAIVMTWTNGVAGVHQSLQCLGRERRHDLEVRRGLVGLRHGRSQHVLVALADLLEQRGHLVGVVEVDHQDGVVRHDDRDVVQAGRRDDTGVLRRDEDQAGGAVDVGVLACVRDHE